MKRRWRGRLVETGAVVDRSFTVAARLAVARLGVESWVGVVGCYRRVFAAVVIGVCSLMLGCMGGYRVRMSGDARHGKDLIQYYGCGSCHTIPGVYTARGKVGPPLMFFAERTMIAGELPNSPDNLVRWMKNPNAIESGTAMPNLGVTNTDAHDVAAYLYTLH